MWAYDDFFNTTDAKDSPLISRQQREFELRGMLANHVGRNQLTLLLRQYLNVPSGQLPGGTPFVETILAHEYANQPSAPVMPVDLLAV